MTPVCYRTRVLKRMLNLVLKLIQMKMVVEGHTGSSQGVVCQLRHQMVESMSDHSQTVPGVTNDTLLHTGSTGSTDSVNVNDRV